MSTIADLRIETWGDKYLVVAQFKGMLELPRQEFTHYKDALRELAKIAQREEIRYESHIGHGSDW